MGVGCTLSILNPLLLHYMLATRNIKIRGFPPHLTKGLALSKTKMQKPPRGCKNPSEALFTRPSGRFSHYLLKKAGVMMLVNLKPGFSGI